MYLLGISDVLECLDALSLNARLSKCVSDVLKPALARRLSIQMSFRSAQMRSRSTLVAPNAFPTYSDKALARRLSFQMRFQCAQMSSRSTRVGPNELAKRSDALSLDAGRSECMSDVLRRGLARRLSIQKRFRSARVSSRTTLVYPSELPTWSDRQPCGIPTWPDPDPHKKVSK